MGRGGAGSLIGRQAQRAILGQKESGGELAPLEQPPEGGLGRRREPIQQMGLLGRVQPGRGNGGDPRGFLVFGRAPPQPQRHENGAYLVVAQAIQGSRQSDSTFVIHQKYPLTVNEILCIIIDKDSLWSCTLASGSIADDEKWCE